MVFCEGDELGGRGGAAAQGGGEDLWMDVGGEVLDSYFVEAGC